MSGTSYAVGFCLAVLARAPDLTANIRDCKQQTGDAAESKPILIESSAPVHSLAYSHDGKFLAVGDHNGGIRVFDALTGKLQFESAKAHAQLVAALFFLPDQRLISCSRDEKKNVACWDLKKNHVDTVVKGLSDGVMAFAVSPDHTRICVGKMTELQVYTFETGKLDQRINLKGTIESIAWRPCGEHVAVLASNQLAVVDCKRGRLRFARETRFLDLTGLTLVAFSHDGKLIATGGEDGAVDIWEFVTGQPRVTVNGDVVSLGVAFLPAGDLLLTTHRDSVRLWNARTGKQRMKWDASVPHVLCISPQGKSFAWANLKGVTIVHCEKALFEAAPKPEPAEEAQIKGWLTDLSSEKAADAGAAVASLIAQADHVLPAIADAIWIAPETDAEQVGKWIRELDDTFAVRKRAAQELEALGELVRIPLEFAIESADSPHHREEIGRVLRAIDSKLPTGAELRTHRVIEVLEHIGSNKAVEALRRIAKGNAASSVTREAKGAIQRLTKQP